MLFPPIEKAGAYLPVHHTMDAIMAHGHNSAAV